ncbi:hypothetical protein BDQ17DRAFT_1193459, partial [Cyathus striatus]
GKTICTGSLGSKTKSELEDIARSLRLSTTGSKAAIEARILKHYGLHPEQK